MKIKVCNLSSFIKGCTKLQEIHIFSKSPSSIIVDESTFYNVDYDCTLYVPKGTVKDYRSHKVFGRFKEIVEEE